MWKTVKPIASAASSQASHFRRLRLLPPYSSSGTGGGATSCLGAAVIGLLLLPEKAKPRSSRARARLPNAFRACGWNLYGKRFFGRLMPFSL